MDESFAGNLRLWDRWAASAPLAPSLALAPASPDLADRLYTAEALRAPGRDREGAEPYSLQWFLDIESHRHGRHGRWIPRLLEFAKHAGETLLGLGEGLGTDWLQYARHGARVVVGSTAAEQLALIRRNFELRGLSGRFLHARPTALPLKTASIDVVCLSSLPAEADDPRAVVDEVYRVLKPGGKVLAVAPARYDIDFWHHLCFPWQRWLRLRPGPALPPALRFTRRRLRRLFGRFIEHRIYKRQLRRAEVPHLWRCLPLPLLERLVGRLLIVKAFKPLSAAMAAPLAA